jgi:hypothetical protein
MFAHSKMPVAIHAGFGNRSHMNWPHGPAYWLFEAGLYIITAGTYRKLPHLDSPARLDFFQNSLFQYADEFGWDLRGLGRAREPLSLCCGVTDRGSHASEISW